MRFKAKQLNSYFSINLKAKHFCRSKGPRSYFRETNLSFTLFKSSCIFLKPESDSWILGKHKNSLRDQIHFPDVLSALFDPNVCVILSQSRYFPPHAHCCICIQCFISKEPSVLSSEDDWQTPHTPAPPSLRHLDRLLRPDKVHPELSVR